MRRKLSENPIIIFSSEPTFAIRDDSVLSEIGQLRRRVYARCRLILSLIGKLWQPELMRNVGNLSVSFVKAPLRSSKGVTTLSGRSDCDTLILLVGSNPLPNYVAARALQPRRVLMIYTSGPTGTEEIMKRLRSVFKARLQIEVLPPCSVRRSSAQDIRDVLLKHTTPNTHLNYTGGTKVMAAHARMAFGEAFRTSEGSVSDDSRASYVDERKGAILFDDGSEIPISPLDLGLSLEDLAKLHGVIAKPTVRSEGGPTSQDIHEVLRREVYGRGSIRAPLAKKGNWFRQVSFTKALSDPFRPEQHGLRLSVERIPCGDWSEERLGLWQRFLSNGWLELWVSDLIEQITGQTPQWSIDCELESRPGTGNSLMGREFEVDLAVIQDRRLHVVSCTTNGNEDTCKMKLFEVGYRARQLGGDLARAALVCFLDGVNSHTRQLKVDMVQQDVQILWNAPNKPRVFGLSDIRKWSGCQDDPDVSTFRRWLDS